MVGIRWRQHQRRRIDAPRRQRRERCRDDRPRRAGGEQDRADHDLEQKERREGIGEPAAMVKLPAERRDVEQQRGGQFSIGYAATAAKQGGAREIDRDQHEDRPEQRRARPRNPPRSEEHTSELPSLMRISYAVICMKKKK